MDHAVDETSRPRVKEMLLAGSKMGLTVCRTWAFNDAAYHALQLTPAQFDENVFKGLMVVGELVTFIPVVDPVAGTMIKVLAPAGAVGLQELFKMWIDKVQATRQVTST